MVYHFGVVEHTDKLRALIPNVLVKGTGLHLMMHGYHFYVIVAEQHDRSSCHHLV